ncbi:response regulator transcription factor [Pseudoalteromonas luteoviolacea]|uniref:response regulator n=1 Tax=Pseudoalteromonas luteoviolacea TaxID=43657 RepID=UPI001F22C56E|nr:response regulator transcription factor [Pseudoalteromonas luteoviolacea]MCF6441393.1 response regulator transcription factor [Pseudoalteromonas luteoviolacea]
MGYDDSSHLTILIADDHHLIRQGLHSLIMQSHTRYQVDDVATGEQAWQYITEHEPDLAILDVSMGSLCGLKVCERVKQKKLKTRIIFLSMYDDVKIIRRALEIGADGYLSKSEAFATLNQAIKVVTSGQSFISPDIKAELAQHQSSDTHKTLTNREKQIVSYISQGKSNRQTADILCISVKTVDNHRTKVMKKLGVKKAAELVKYALEERLIV